MKTHNGYVSTQFGFIQLSLMGWVVLIMGTVVLGLSIAVKVQTARLEASEAKHAAFVADVRAKGEAAQRAADAQKAADLKRKQEADRENETSRTRIATLARQLRDARSGSRFVPPAAPGAASPGIARFDRAELERALQRADDGITRLVAEGDQARIDLDTAKRWAQQPAADKR